MSVVVSDLRFFASERLTDEDDGGGMMSGTEIVSGTQGVFDDISDVDRAVGDCSLRKIYAAVTSDTDDKYLDAGIVVFSPPEDENVSVLAFSTGSFFDERSALKAKVESGISRGGMYGGYLYGDHISGQRSVTLWQRETTDIPNVGRRLEIVSNAASQVLWVTKITHDLLTKYDATGAFVVRRVICEIAEPLAADYVGTEPNRYDMTSPATRVYETRYNAGALPLYGIKPLAADADLGDFAVRIPSLYAPLIPTAFNETDIPDAVPGGNSAALVLAGTDAASFTTALNVIGPSKSLYLGSPIYPGTLSIVVSGSTITDDGGKLLLAAAEIGSVAYATGTCVFNSACPSYGTASKAISFTCASVPRRVQDSAAQSVTVENRGFVWVLTLAPIPAPSTLQISYRVNNEWYTITDDGSGALSGADSSYGSGTLDFTTGTTVMQTAELPDVGSEIIYSWGTAANYFERGGEPVAPVTVKGTTANPNVIPGTVSVSWANGATTYTLTDEDPPAEGEVENLNGTGGKGFIDYASGRWWVKPTLLPAMGTELALDYEWGATADLVTDSFPAPTPDANGKVSLTLSELPSPGTLKVAVDVTVAPYVDSEGQEVNAAPAPEAPVDPAAGFVIWLDMTTVNNDRAFAEGYFADAPAGGSPVKFTSRDAAQERIASLTAGLVTVIGDTRVMGSKLTLNGTTAIVVTPSWSWISACTIKGGIY